MSFITRVIGIFLLCSLIFFSTSAHAQDGANKGANKNAGVSGVLLDFGDMSNGWNLNAQCKALKRAERREFEWGYYRLNALIEEELGAEVVAQINKTAIEFAKAHAHKECGPETAKLISRALVTSQHMNKALTDTAYDPDTSYNEHLSAQFMTIESGLRIDAHCRHISPALVATIGRAHDAMIGYTMRAIGGNAINKLLSDAEKISKDPVFETCGPETEKAVHAASLGLRQLIDLIEHDSSLAE